MQATVFNIVFDNFGHVMAWRVPRYSEDIMDLFVEISNHNVTFVFESPIGGVRYSHTEVGLQVIDSPDKVTLSELSDIPGADLSSLTEAHVTRLRDLLFPVA
jgi:hypothetical protein